MKTNNKTFNLVLTAMFIALTAVAILFIRVPIPFTQGYVHLGDAVIFLGILVLGWKYGSIAAALGGMLGDLIGGFPIWAPWSFGIKGVMALIIGLIIYAYANKRDVSGDGLIRIEIVAMIIAGVFETIAYFVAEGIMYGNWAVALTGVPWNVGQFVVGMVVATIICKALIRTPARKYFAYVAKAAA